MAIVKVSYTKHTAAAKQTVRYIAHRPGKDGAKITRTLFGSDGVMGKQHAYRMIDAAEQHTFFYRIAISPDPAIEDTHKDIYLWELTEQTMMALAERLQKDILYGECTGACVNGNISSKMEHQERTVDYASYTGIARSTAEGLHLA